MKLHEKVEGKGYFVGYKCKNCSKTEAEHKSDGKNCIVDARKTIHDYHSDKFLRLMRRNQFLLSFYCKNKLISTLRRGK